MLNTLDTVEPQYRGQMSAGTAHASRGVARYRTNTAIAKFEIGCEIPDSNQQPTRIEGSGHRRGDSTCEAPRVRHRSATQCIRD